MPGEDNPRVMAGEPIYDGQGRLLGTVRGFDAGGFFVTTAAGIESNPEACPGRGTPREDRNYWTEG